MFDDAFAVCDADLEDIVFVRIFFVKNVSLLRQGKQ